MKMIKTALFSLVTCALGTSSALANDYSVSSNLTLTSDYVFRGVSQTNEDPAIQGGFDLALESGWYAGVWASNVGFGEGSTEADIYAGWSQPLNDNWALDFGVIRYLYPSGNGAGAEFNYNEIYTNITFRDFNLNIVYSDDYFGTGVDSFYYVAGDYGYQFTEKWSVNLHAGLNQFDSENELTQFLGAAPTTDDAYWDWSVTLNYSLTDSINLDLGYIDTDIDKQSCVEICDGRMVVSLSSSF